MADTEPSVSRDVYTITECKMNGKKCVIVYPTAVGYSFRFVCDVYVIIFSIWFLLGISCSNLFVTGVLDTSCQHHIGEPWKNCISKKSFLFVCLNYYYFFFLNYYFMFKHMLRGGHHVAPI